MSYLALGRVAQKKKDWREAFVQFDRGAGEDVACLVERALCYLNGRGVEKDTAKGFADLELAAQRGSADAKLHLSNLYEIGVGVEKDREKFLRLAKEAAEEGSVPGMLKWGTLLMAKGPMQNIELGVQYVARAAEAGLPIAVNALGVMYVAGNGVERNPKYAQELFARVADVLPEAKCNLAATYLDGCAGVRDPAKSFVLVQEAAEAGYVPAKVQLALRYQNGQGVEKNPEKARAAARSAAEAGSADGQNLYGTMLLVGMGGEKDLGSARLWFEKAAEKGHPAGLNNYGICLLNGVGGEKNQEEATKRFRLAREKGNPDAPFNLALCYMTGAGVHKNEFQAYAYFVEAAKRGHKQAPVHVGWCLLKGLGVARDEAAGRNALNRAVAEGNPLALFFVGLAEREGAGYVKNPTEGERKIQTAAKQGVPQAVEWLRKQNNAKEETKKEGQGLLEKARGLEQTGDWAGAALVYREAAEQGIVEGMVAMADICEKGRGVKVNATEAAVWWERAYAKGSVPASVGLARALWNGVGTEKNRRRAFSVVQQAALLGYGPACYQLAVWYGEGWEEARPDKENMRKWAAIAYERGVREAEKLLR
ncbi:MAG: sel1 repeat family protein [Clostridia bacterium]|nr:sel1 repeat family protein [Clostridia bacterium]